MDLLNKWQICLKESSSHFISTFINRNMRNKGRRKQHHCCSIDDCSNVEENAVHLLIALFRLPIICDVAENSKMKSGSEPSLDRP